MLQSNNTVSGRTVALIKHAAGGGARVELLPNNNCGTVSAAPTQVTKELCYAAYPCAGR
ncbi:hypothetical protein AERO9A_370122 [Aeromonas salmonicida]|nr:hypothetical protein AERO9A_370122 [Aeromonas salmonicida]